MTFKLTKDHYVLKEDIPDEETFNKIVQAFVDIGGIKIDGYGSWPRRNVGVHFAIGLYQINRIFWLCKGQIHDKTRATPQQILGDNYMKDPLYPNGKADDIVNVELTRKDLVLLTVLTGEIRGYNSLLTPLYEKIQDISGAYFSGDLNLQISGTGAEHIKEFIDSHFAPRKPTEKELLQAKIAELEELDDHQDR